MPTSRLALPVFADSEVAAFANQVNSVTTQLDAVVPRYLQDTAAKRPAAGIAGRLFEATDTGAVSWDTGTAWITVSLGVVERGVATTATPGELVKATANIAVTSPAAVVNTSFGALANGHTVTIKAATGKIFGDFLAEAGVTEVTLVGYQHLELVSDGTNWLIVAGEPKREAKFAAQVARAAATPFKPSATRESEVVLEFTTTGTASAEVRVTGTGLLATVGGELGGALTAKWPLSFRVPANDEWEWIKVVGTVSVNSSYRIL